MTRGRAELALAGVTVIWGTTFVVVKSALSEVSPVLFIALRFLLATAVLGLIYRKALRARGIGPGIAAGILLFGAYVCQTVGLGLTTPSKSAFLTSLSIPMVPLASSLVYKNRPRLFEIAGIAIASFGMVLMTFPGSLFSGGFEMSRGDLLSFLCAVLFALHIVVIGHFAPLIGFESLAVIQVGTAAVLGSSLFWVVEPVRFLPSAGVATAVLTTGLLATALAFTTMAWAQQYTSATRAALIFALEPVVAWLTSRLLTGERMPDRGKVGAGLILAGIVLVEVRKAGRKRERLVTRAAAESS